MKINLTSHTNKTIKIISIDVAKAIQIRSQWNQSKFYQYAFDSEIEFISPECTMQFVGHIDDATNPMGYIQVYTTKNPAVLWIQTIAISELFLRKGYGSILYNTVVEYFNKKQPIQQIYLACDSQNYTGLKFWESLGFKTESKQNYHNKSIMIMINNYRLQGDYRE